MFLFIMLDLIVNNKEQAGYMTMDTDNTDGGASQISGHEPNNRSRKEALVVQA